MADTLLGSETAEAATETEATTTATTEASTNATTTETAAAAETNAANGSEPENKGEASKAPAEYTDFTPPEGATLHADYVTEVKGIAKELGLTQEAAQRLSDFGLKQVQGLQEASQKQLDDTRAGWADQARADKEYGGDKLPENLALAKKSLETFASPALKELLEGSGLGNHPEVIRLFVKLGNAISEDKIVTGNGTGPGSRDAASTLYPNQPRAA